MTGVGRGRDGEGEGRGDLTYGHEFIKRTMRAYNIREHVASQSITRIFIHDICHPSRVRETSVVVYYNIISYVDIMTIIAPAAQNIIILHIMASIMPYVCVCPLSSFIMLYEICRMIDTVMYVYIVAFAPPAKLERV